VSAAWLLVAIGKARQGPEAALFARYNARLRPPLLLRELPDGRGAGAAAIKAREGAALLDALPEGALLVALDQGGAAPDSAGLARLVARWRESGRSLAFAIGGAEGLDAAVLKRADASLSFGPQTGPHLLVRAMLAEQLWRAQAIATGHPYHRAGRPD